MESLKIWGKVKTSLSDHIDYVAQRKIACADPDILWIPRVVNIVEYFIVRVDFRVVVDERLRNQCVPSLRSPEASP